jgi:hypothetical protein
MSERIVQIDGRETAIREERIPLDEVILDATNPRIQFQRDSALSDGEPSQEALGLALTVTNDQYYKLRENVESNGGILNPIWVVWEASRYLVIEGNTRVLCYQDMCEKYPNDPKWHSIPAYILPERCSRQQVNFIRLEAHLFGTTPWDAYEKARELYRLSTEEDYSIDRLTRLTKLTASDIRNHIQAFRDMKEQYLRRFSEPGEPQKFSYFVEFRKNSDLKRLVKEGELSLLDFCEWVGEGKFRRGEDVRRLAQVLRDPEAHQTLLDHDFAAALDQLAQVDPAAKSRLFEKIEDVCQGIRSMPFEETDEIMRGRAPAKIQLLEELSQVTSSFLDAIRRD